MNVGACHEHTTRNDIVIFSFNETQIQAVQYH
jgi:hypothetical protein